jgi:microcystin-dependent protein
MLKATYDPTSSGTVSNAAHVPWAGITGIPAGVTLPSGTVLDFAGPSVPAGFLACDGTSYPTASYPTLFAAIGYYWGGSGANFNVPDLRSRTTIGSYWNGSAWTAPPGLTARVTGQTGGEETHALVIGEMAVHNHTINISDPWHQHTQAAHYHPISDQQHAHVGGNHQHWIGSHSHNVSDPGHAHTTYYHQIIGGTLILTYAPGGAGGLNYQGATTGSYGSGTGISVPSSNAFWSDGDVGGRGGVATDYRYTGIANTNWAGNTTVDAHATGITASSANNGSGTGHQNMPPFGVVLKIIKT